MPSFANHNHSPAQTTILPAGLGLIVDLVCTAPAVCKRVSVGYGRCMFHLAREAHPCLASKTWSGRQMPSHQACDARYHGRPRPSPACALARSAAAAPEACASCPSQRRWEIAHTRTSGAQLIVTVPCDTVPSVSTGSTPLRQPHPRLQLAVCAGRDRVIYSLLAT